MRRAHSLASHPDRSYAASPAEPGHSGYPAFPSVDRIAYRALHLAYILFPLLSGIDKYFHRLVNWDQYVSPLVQRTLAGYAHPLLLAMGAAEIVMGIGMLFRPRLFGYLLAIYMFIIVLNLLSTGAFYDIALRDFCIALSSLALARLSRPAAQT